MVYIIKIEKYVKIGFTENPIKRIKSIQGGLPSDLDVLLLIEGTMELEKKLHYQFKEDRNRGEWFFFSQDIKDYISLMMNGDLRYKYGYTESKKNELMPVRRHRINCGLTLNDLGALLGITKQGALGLEQSGSKGSISIYKMSEIARVTGYKFEFRFTKIKVS